MLADFLQAQTFASYIAFTWSLYRIMCRNGNLIPNVVFEIQPMQSKGKFYAMFR